MKDRAARWVPTLAIMLALITALGACTPIEPVQPITPATTPTATAVAASSTAPASPVQTPEAEGLTASLAGEYLGAISVSGQQLEFGITLTEAGGVYTGTMDIPLQGAFDIPLENLIVDGNQVGFTIMSEPRQAGFAGEADADGNIVGAFTQSGAVGTFALQPVVAEPVPYAQEEVTFGHGDITLAGTLTIPEGEGPFPAVVLVTGSGAQDRDENVMGFAVFATLADNLTRQGVAVLRYDDRGVRGSTGDLAQATLEDLAQDALAGVSFLQGCEEILPDAIGILGHSEGAMLAPMAANQSDAVAFVVLMAGPATTGEQVLKDQLELILSEGGASAEEMEAARASQAAAIKATKTGEGFEEVAAAAEVDLRAQIEALSAAQRQVLGDIDEYVKIAVGVQIAQLMSPSFKYFVEYDPVPDLEVLQVPALALFGTLDLQVPAATNVQPMSDALAASGVEHRVVTMEGANHLFQQAVTGSPDEYPVLPREFIGGFVDTIVGWVKGQGS